MGKSKRYIPLSLILAIVSLYLVFISPSRLSTLVGIVLSTPFLYYLFIWDGFDPQVGFLDAEYDGTIPHVVCEIVDVDFANGLEEIKLRVVSCPHDNIIDWHAPEFNVGDDGTVETVLTPNEFSGGFLPETGERVKAELKYVPGIDSLHGKRLTQVQRSRREQNKIEKTKESQEETEEFAMGESTDIWRLIGNERRKLEQERKWTQEDDDAWRAIQTAQRQYERDDMSLYRDPDVSASKAIAADAFENLITHPRHKEAVLLWRISDHFPEIVPVDALFSLTNAEKTLGYSEVMKLVVYTLQNISRKNPEKLLPYTSDIIELIPEPKRGVKGSLAGVWHSDRTTMGTTRTYKLMTVILHIAEKHPREVEPYTMEIEKWTKDKVDGDIAKDVLRALRY